MTVPNNDGFVGASVTEDQFKQNLVQLLDHIRSLTSGFDLKNGKVYDFASILDFEAIKTKIPAGSIVVIEWGEEYGAYVWDGTNLTKSQYDLLALAKSDATAKAATAKSEAISAATTDASTKANTAEAKAKQAAENNDVRMLKSIQKLTEVISDFYLEFSTLSQSNSNLQQTTGAQNIRFNTSIQKLTNAISLFRANYDVVASDLTTKTATNSAIIQKLHVGLQATQGVLGQVIENITVDTQDDKLQKLMMVHGLVLGLSQLDGFNPKSSTNGGGGSSAAVQSNGFVLFKTPSTVLRINIEADAPLPTSKGTVINTKVSMNVEGSSFDGYGTLEVQGSSSVAFPKKNWTLGFFTDEAREEAVKVKLGHMMPHDELVFKANFVDNTHCRNIGVNRIWDQMQMSRTGYPKREPDFVNMINNDLTVENYNGLKYQPTGALGHVDGFPCVMYINGDFYGIGTINIGKKRDNYNLKKDDQKHIQFEPEGGINLNNMPVDPTDGSFDLRRPATWGSAAQASYDRLSAFFKLSVADMVTAGIDNYLNRAQMIDYIILLQVCDLFDHLHKNTMFTTWDGKVWNLLPYDLDNCFGLYFTGQYFNPSTGVAYRPPINLPIPPLGQVPNSSWGVASRLRAVYGTDVDKRYKFLRDSGIISNDNFMKIFEGIVRFFPKELLEAEDEKWNTGSTSINESLLQTGSLYQINQWLTERLVRTDIYFNYSI